MYGRFSFFQNRGCNILIIISHICFHAFLSKETTCRILKSCCILNTTVLDNYVDLSFIIFFVVPGSAFFFKADGMTF